MINVIAAINTVKNLITGDGNQDNSTTVGAQKKAEEAGTPEQSKEPGSGEEPSTSGETSGSGEPAGAKPSTSDDGGEIIYEMMCLIAKYGPTRVMGISYVKK